VKRQQQAVAKRISRAAERESLLVINLVAELPARERCRVLLQAARGALVQWQIERSVPA